MFQVEISKGAQKELHSIPKKDRKRIDKKFLTLSSYPDLMGCKKLVGYEQLYRIRQGKYRIVFEVEKKKVVIIVIKVDQRKDVFRSL